MPLLLGNIKSPCGSSGTCSQTVTVFGTCYRGSEVNYALFGKMCSLCDISQPSMDAIIIGWKLWEKPGPYDGQLHEALAWANAGFVGLGGIGPRSPYSDRTYCSPCSTPFPDVIFNWHAGGMSGTK